MNFAEHINLFYQSYGEGNTNRFPVNLLKEWFNEAETKVNSIAKCIFKEHIINSVDNTPEYAFPTDLIDYDIRKVYYSNTDSTERVELDYMDIPELDEADASWRERTGVPDNWYINKETSKFGFCPYEVSVSTGTNCIRAIYRGSHTKMTRYYTTGTVSITRGSKAVTGSGTSFTTNVEAGDYLGIGKLLDNTTAFPPKWYEIDTVDSTLGVTLVEDFDDPSDASGAYYIIAQNSSIPYDKLNTCSIQLVMAKAELKDHKYNLADYMDVVDRVEYEIKKIKREIVIIPAANFRPQFPRGEFPISKDARFYNDYEYKKGNPY